MQANSLPVNKNTSLDMEGEKPEHDCDTGVPCLEPGLSKGKTTEQGYHKASLTVWMKLSY